MRPQNNLIKLRAFAKINLTLKVSPKRSDGYHEIDSIMQSVSLHDEIELKKIPSGVKISCTIDIKDNIAAKAAQMVLKECNIDGGVDIHINKQIPLAAGMAGGSADAAAVIYGINALYGLNLHVTKLMDIGSRIGSDVPFCLVGGTARCTGIGERVEKLDQRSGNSFILVVPDISVPTRSVYEEFDRLGPSGEDNELERPAVDLFPGIAKEKQRLMGITGEKWKMSGSGPTLFMEMRDLSEAEKFSPLLQASGIKFNIVRLMEHGVETVSG
jgi:4-diphosphocytidyl-2-C-methyl-D-erythritol kinase